MTALKEVERLILVRGIDPREMIDKIVQSAVVTGLSPESIARAFIAILEWDKQERENDANPCVARTREKTDG